MKHRDFGKAVYIKAQEKPSTFSLYDPIPMFRKEFEIAGEVKTAQIVVQSPGFACYYINGKPVTQDLFISPLSNYNKLLWYNTYDVKSLLQSGTNTLAVMAGNGFFNETFDTVWHHKDASWRDAPQFLLSLTVNGKIVVESDASWKTSRERSPIIYSHLRSGEYYDARKADDSWMLNGYDDQDWQTVYCREIPQSAELRLTPCQPVREMECIKPVFITKTDEGYLVDFGVTMSGYIQITVQESRDAEILLRYCEDLDADMHLKYNGMNKPYFYPESPFHLDKIIASGGVDTFKPKFCYHGFRYVLIEGLSKAPDPALIRAYFTHQDVARTADFQSGNPILNYIYQAGIRSTYSNLFWSLTDCPTREKLGWTNDAAATAEQILINFDIKPLFEKWYEDIKLDTCEDGSLPGVIPSHGWGDNWGPVCDNLLYELPYRTYLYTGDSSMLIGAIPYFEHYVAFLWQKKEENHEFILGDWLGSGSSKLTPKEFVRDFYLIKALRITTLAHRLKGDDDRTWQAKTKQIEDEFIATYVDDEGKATVTSQTALAMLLQFGLYRERDIISKQLAEAVVRDEFKLTSGMVGIQYLYDALTACGHPEYAYKIITESEPGYKTWYLDGATTLWEIWNGKDKGSHNHHMFSNVLAWFYKSLLGIVPKENAPAFAEIDLQPAFLKEIGFVKGYEDTVRGRIEVEWSYQNGEFTYKVTVPVGIKANFRGRELTTGVNRFVIKDETQIHKGEE
ncbi:MAG: family 78 glycoside hydrolase catalytic domain [Clostridia bacterium]|nr:family 78 glycoside hydrolase catalytic domain [Clostridia bacterium]